MKIYRELSFSNNDNWRQSIIEIKTCFMMDIRSFVRGVIVLSLLLYLPGLAPVTAQVYHRIIHVAKTGSDTNDGSAGAPLLTISKAESIARPGDNIIVYKGTYREMIVLHSGGTSQNSRITFKTAPGNEVIIKGSERIKSWVRQTGNTWRTDIDESFFKGFNPFNEFINKDSSFVHLGGVYLENHPLKEKKDLIQVANIKNTWFTMQQNGKTIITANFGQSDPNVKLTELNVRPAVFSAIKTGISEVVIDGFTIAQVASPMASINGEQPGAISVNGGFHWVIQNCLLSDCKSVAISIGQTGHSYPDAGPGKPEYSDLSQDTANVGHHIISHNHIFRCGQAGIFGLLHGSFSEISDNLVEDINSDGEYPAAESSGIRLVLSVDVQISHNLIRRVNGNSGGYGLFLGPLFQGANITRNIISDTRQSCIYLFNSHGPALISNNILCGPGKINAEGIQLLSAEANVLVQNLFYDCGFSNNKVPGKSFATSNFLPHSLIIKQTIPALTVDDRWFCNLFIKGGLNQLAGYTDCKADYNVYLDGAVKSSWGDKQSKNVTGVTNLKLIHTAKGVSLSFNDRLIPAMTCPALSPSLIGFFTLSKQYIEYPDGRPITINHDFNKVAANKSSIIAGPFYRYPAINGNGQILFTY